MSSLLYYEVRSLLIILSKEAIYLVDILFLLGVIVGGSESLLTI